MHVSDTKMLCHQQYFVMEITLPILLTFISKKAFLTVTVCQLFTKATVINKAEPLQTYNLPCAAGLYKIGKNVFSWISSLLHHVIQNVSQLLQFKYDLKKIISDFLELYI